jgi:hypothetical protein
MFELLIGKFVVGKASPIPALPHSMISQATISSVTLGESYIPAFRRYCAEWDTKLKAWGVGAQ